MDDAYRSLDLLRQTHSFPCRYTFKLIGEGTDDLRRRATAAVATAAATAPTVTCRPSRTGRHQALGLTVLVPDAEAVLRIYAVLRGLSGVHTLL